MEIAKSSDRPIFQRLDPVQGESRDLRAKLLEYNEAPPNSRRFYRAAPFAGSPRSAPNPGCGTTCGSCIPQVGTKIWSTYMGFMGF